MSDVETGLSAPLKPETGVGVIEATLRTLPNSPGVYRMLGARDAVLYVGKARSLKKRVASYTRLARLPVRIARMVSLTERMEILTTHTEAEALLLEANLIKQLKPRFNILLKDDKSFPYIRITGGHDFPRIEKHRGKRAPEDLHFGPFASAWAVNKTINHLQKAFLLRSCSDAVFSHRTRPCLLYQIKRCAAPCVDYLSKQAYGELVEICRDFLTGKSDAVIRDLETGMMRAAEQMDFEQAAVYRDRIRALAHIRSHQEINLTGIEEADVVSVHMQGGQSCVQVFFFRSGSHFGNRAYYPSHPAGATEQEVLSAFLSQFYSNKPAPRLILLSHPAEGAGLIGEALSVSNNRKIDLAVPKRGNKHNLVVHALQNARDALGRRMAESATQRKLLNGLAEVLALESSPERIEIYDNSHIQGSHPVGGMVVAGGEGFIKNAYRKFNIKNKETEPGDDYAMMREMLTRRFARGLKEDRDSADWPDLCLIDGGKGQLSVAMEVMEALGIDDVTLIGVAKGEDRHAGREVIHHPKLGEIRLPQNDPVLYFIQRLRDEAHRWAIGAHRTRRSKAIGQSGLEDIAGIGAARKKALLHRFGSAKGVSRAGLADLEACAGISRAMAKKIYDHFNGDG